MTDTDTTRRKGKRGLRMALVVALLAALVGLFLWWPDRGTHKFVGLFSSAVGLYPGDSVRVVGVPVGTSVGTSVGVVGAFSAARRRELFDELQPLVCDLADHPWGRLAEMASERRGAGSRWNPDKSLSFVPLRPERVLEVRYDHMEGARFRHPPQFVRDPLRANPR